MGGFTVAPASGVYDLITDYCYVQHSKQGPEQVATASVTSQVAT